MKVNVMSESRFRWCVAAVLCLAGALAYVNTFDGDWVWDDASSVLLHQHVQNPSKFFQLFREDQHAFGRGAGNFYRPLVSASFMLDCLWARDGRAAGAAAERPHPSLKTLPFHISNTLWHIAAALLLFVLLTQLDAPRFVRAAAPLIYVLHPLHTEAVAYISGRADMMSAVFMYVGLCFALWMPPTPAKRILGWVAGAASFGAALLSKESSFIFPVLLALCVFLRPWTGQETTMPNKARLRRLIPLVIAGVLMAAYAGLRMTVLKFSEAASVPGSGLGQRLFETLQAFAFYMRVLFLPFGLHMEQTLAGVSGWHAVAGGLLLCAVLALLFLSVRKGQWRMALGIAWFLAAWFPISGIFPLNAPMAEHWMYVPMAGFWWVLAELTWMVCSRPPVGRTLAVAATGMLCLFFLTLTVQRNEDWHNNERLFRSTLAHNPDSARVHFNLAVTYEDLQGNLAGARRHYEALLRIYDKQKRAASRPGEDTRRNMLPEEIEAHLSLGKILMRQGAYTDAMVHLAPLTGLAKNEAYGAYAGAAALSMGRCFLALGEPVRADAFFRESVRIDTAAQAEVQDLLTGAPLQE